jgi:hypothetical protein
LTGLFRMRKRMSSIARICKDKEEITKHDKFLILTFSSQLRFLFFFIPDVIIRYDENKMKATTVPQFISQERFRKTDSEVNLKFVKSNNFE